MLVVVNIIEGLRSKRAIKRNFGEKRVECTIGYSDACCKYWLSFKTKLPGDPFCATARIVASIAISIIIEGVADKLKICT